MLKCILRDCGLFLQGLIPTDINIVGMVEMVVGGLVLLAFASFIKASILAFVHHIRLKVPPQCFLKGFN
jgi:hypothetical protein